MRHSAPPLPRLARPAVAVALAAALAALAAPAPAAAQYRFGISFGGASSFAVVAEYRWAHQGLEVQAGSLRFSDLSISASAKQYIGSYAAEPYVGIGLWAIGARSEPGTGYGLIARLPVGVNWNFADSHAAGLAIYLNRALAIRRPDPDDERPPRSVVIPLPELSYRWAPG